MTHDETHESQLTELECAIQGDEIWAVTTLSVREEFGGFVIAVANECVWGKGDNAESALADALAQPGCPPRERLALIGLPTLGV